MSHQTPWYSEIWAASVHRTHGGVSWNHQSVLALSSKVFCKPSAESWKAEEKRKALCLVTGQTVYIDREMWFPNLCTFWKSTANCLECLFLSFLFIYFCMGWGWGQVFFHQHGTYQVGIERQRAQSCDCPSLPKTGITSKHNHIFSDIDCRLGRSVCTANTFT